jgi:DNA-binding transcriptional MerR regulator
MAAGSDPFWTIDELGAEVAAALAAGYAGAPNARVREVPDRRTIRYYTTLGLLDRPAAMRGRTALYNRRHLRQLVAIKRLQARGLSLAEVQERLLGLNDAALARLAELPQGGPAPPSRATRDFWRAQPAEPTARLVVEVPLQEDVRLLLASSRPIDDDELRAIRTAAAPLIKLLRARRLIDADTQTQKQRRGDDSAVGSPARRE